VSPLRKRYARLTGWQWLADNHTDQVDAWEKQHLDLVIHFDNEVPSILSGYCLVHGDIHQLNLLVQATRFV
jgi:Ser/Thr protein kinase RdoA (MazF antagonist)